MPHSDATARAHAAVDVLANRVLWDAITACMKGYPRAVADFVRDSSSTHSNTLERAKQRLTPATAHVVGHLSHRGELVHLAIAANDADMLDTLHRVSTLTQYQHDVKLGFQKAMRCAVVCNSVSMLEHIVKLKRGAGDDDANQLVWEPNLMTIALLRDDPDPRMLDWLATHLPRKSYSLTHKSLALHVERGDLATVQWLHEHGRTISKAAMDAAARNNHLHVLQYFYEHSAKRCSHDGADVTAERGHVDVVKLLLAKQTRQVSSRAIEFAAMCGHLELVQLFFEHPEYEVSGHWDTVAQLAAYSGHLDIVQFFHENRPSHCSSTALDHAARRGHLAIVQYLHANNHETCAHVCEPSAFDEASLNGYLDVVKFLHEHRTEGCTDAALAGAAKNGHLDVVTFLLEHRSEGNIVDALEVAALCGHLAVVQLLHSRLQRGDSTFDAVLAALRRQHYDIAGFLCEHQEHASERILTQAVSSDALQVVKTAARFASMDELMEAKTFAEEHSRRRIAASIGFTIENQRRQQRP